MIIDLHITLYLLAIIIIILAFLAAEFKNIAYAIISLFAVTVIAGIIFFTVGAIYVGLVQLAVFSGAIIVLFIFVLIMTRGGATEK